MKKTILTISLLGIALISLGSDKTPWNVPDKNEKTINTTKSNAVSIAAGKILWTKYCESCHGKTGLGDGKKASTLDTEPGNFSKAEIQKQSDGSLCYKITEGREDMPSFKKKITNNDIWNIVNFIRTLKK